MNQFVSSVSIPDLAVAIERACSEAPSVEAKEYLSSVLALAPEERVAWFLAQDDEQAHPEIWHIVIQTICAVVVTTITVWNEYEKRWVKEKQQENKCKEKTVRTPCPDPPCRHGVEG